jgi:hypothetical protein
MKIAIQISGEFRMLHLCLPALHTVIKDHDVDFFVHVWRKENDGETYPFEGRGIWHKTMFVYGHGQGIAAFQPRSYLVENYEHKKELHSKPRSMSMFYSIYMASQIRKDYEKRMDVKYDVVMRYRTDCIVETPIFQQLPTSDEKPYLVIPVSSRIVNVDGPCEDLSICDWIAWGTPDTMDVYCSTFLMWFEQPSDQIPIPESMLYLQLKRAGLTSPTFLKRPEVDFYLVEGNGQVRGQTRSKNS